MAKLTKGRAGMAVLLFALNSCDDLTTQAPSCLEANGSEFIMVQDRNKMYFGPPVKLSADQVLQSSELAVSKSECTRAGGLIFQFETNAANRCGDIYFASSRHGDVSIVDARCVSTDDQNGCHSFLVNKTAYSYTIDQYGNFLNLNIPFYGDGSDLYYIPASCRDVLL